MIVNRLAQICPHGMVRIQESKVYLTHRFRSDTLSLLVHSIEAGGGGEHKQTPQTKIKQKLAHIQGLGKIGYFLIAITQSYITKAVDRGMGGKSGPFLQPLYHNIQMNSVLKVVIYQSCITLLTVYPLIKKYN